MNEQIIRLHGLITRLEVQGAWGMALVMRGLLKELLDEEKSFTKNWIKLNSFY